MTGKPRRSHASRPFSRDGTDGSFSSSGRRLTRRGSSFQAASWPCAASCAAGWAASFPRRPFPYFSKPREKAPQLCYLTPACTAPVRRRPASSAAKLEQAALLSSCDPLHLFRSFRVQGAVQPGRAADAADSAASRVVSWVVSRAASAAQLVQSVRFQPHAHTRADLGFRCCARGAVFRGRRT